MSKLSDAIFGPQASTSKPKPKAAPMTLEQATAIAKKKNPLLGLPRTDTGLGVQAQLNAGGRLSSPQVRSGVAGMNAAQDRQGAAFNAAIHRHAQPTLDVLQKASNTIELPFTVAGAGITDAEQQIHRGVPWWKALSTQGPAMQNAARLLNAHQFGEARDRYSTTSANANRTRAAAGDRGARFFVQHPSVFGLAGGAQELVNPAALLGGRAAGVLGDLAKAGLTTAGRAVASKVVRGAADASDAVRDPLYRVANSAGEVATGNRFASLRQGAADQFESPAAKKAAANRADVVARKMTQARTTAQAAAQPLVTDVFKGLTKPQKLDVVDAIEGTLPKDAITPDIAKRVTAYRAWRKAIDARTVGNGLAEQHELFSGPQYFPRRGMTMDPALEAGEEQTLRDLELEASRSRGGNNVRRDTLNQNIPSRKYATRQQALFNGVKVNPDWDPAEALYNHAISRERNNILEEQTHELARLGLIVPKETADMWGHPVPARPDYLPFTDIGTTRQFGSPLLKNSAVHPGVRDLIEDLGSQTTSGGLPSALQGVVGALRGANAAASKVLVSQPFYHLPVNVIPNALASFEAEGADVPALLKAIRNPKAAIAAAHEAGADYPYADPHFSTQDLEPFAAQTTKGKIARAARSVPRAINAVSSKLLYKHMQPAVAAATFKALAPKMGEDAAALETRSVLGEPENLTAGENQAGQAFIFPSWLKSQIRRWGRLAATHPEIYQALHSGVEARNQSRGKSAEPFDWSQLIPPVVQNVDKKSGAVTSLSLPSPANRVLGLADAIGNLAMGTGSSSTVGNDFVNMLNPAIGAGVRTFATTKAPPQTPNGQILWDADAPRGEQFKQWLSTVAGRYNPVRGADPSELVGISPQTKPGPMQSKTAYAVEQLFRHGYWGHGASDIPGIEDFRKAAARARKAGDDDRARKLDAMADKMWAKMRAVTQKLQQTGAPK